ncbi:hypothetical protein ONZ45_g4584 [Pleurotus djamor]|nr:hypothetical protein ONZ45_g4584 [Pleurotus djamor]
MNFIKLLSTFGLSFTVLAASQTKAELKPVWSVDVLPEDLAKTGYWHKEYNEKCGVDMIEAHGVNASVSFRFHGSGIVARFLTCNSCSDAELQIDDLPAIVVDLSSRGFHCPSGSPVFVKNDLEDGEHTVTVRRLNDGKILKIMKFEYLTQEVSEHEGIDSILDLLALPSLGQLTGSVLDVFAQQAGRQAAQLAVTYLVAHLFTKRSSSGKPQDKSDASVRRVLSRIGTEMIDAASGSAQTPFQSVKSANSLDSISSREGDKRRGVLRGE